MIEVGEVTFWTRVILELLKRSRKSRAPGEAFLLEDGTKNGGEDLDSQGLAEVFEGTFGPQQLGRGMVNIGTGLGGMG